MCSMDKVEEIMERKRKTREEVLEEIQAKLAMHSMSVYLVMESIKLDYKNGQIDDVTFDKLMAHWRGRHKAYETFSRELALLDNANKFHS